MGLKLTEESGTSMKNFLYSVFLTVPILTPFFTVSAQGIVIERDGKQANPTLVFQGIRGNSELSALVLDNLIKCGWFDVRRGGAADYLVSGTASGNDLQLSLMNGAGRKIADFRVSDRNADQTAAAAVDNILRHEFKIPGICKSKIVFSVEVAPGKREIYMCDFNGRNITRLTTNNTLSVEPAWSPDGQSIVYCYYGMTYTNLIQYRFDINKSRRLTRYKGLNAGGDLSPDGKYVALVLARDNQVDLYIRPTEGGDLIRLTRDSAVEASPAWTPDGRQICYVSDLNGRPQLYMIDPFRRPAPRRLTTLRGSERVTPDFSYEGRLAYSARVGGDYVITVADVQNPAALRSEKAGLPDAPEIVGEGPSWAPDGRHVVVADRGALYVVDTRLGAKRRLLGGKSRTFQPDWSPLLP